MDWNDDGMVSFHQIGGLGGHIQPACGEVIEYFWEPRDFNLAVGTKVNKSMTFNSGVEYKYDSLGNVTSKKQKYIEVTADIERKVGAFSGGYGNYYEYSNIKVSAIQKK